MQRWFVRGLIEVGEIVGGIGNARQVVRKVYPGPVEAIKDVSLDVPDGEFVVLVGPSGCGKSTLLRMIAGLETVTSGEIRIGGRVVNEMEPRRARHRHGVSELCALPAHERPREYGVSP